MRRPPFALALFFYALFVVYGSLVPLEYRPIPLDEALERFRATPWLELGIVSRADWVANLLLFIPLSFLACGLLARRGRSLRNALASLLVFAGCAALCVSLEFVQLYFPARTVSLNDIAAETLGGAVGIAGWWLYGARVWAAWQARTTRTGGVSPAEAALWVYLFLLFGYNVLPLDLTLSPVELFHKWQDGRVVLVPFAFAFADPAQQLYDLSTDVALWALPGLLGVLATRRSPRSVWLRLVLAACALEFLQLWVYSRISDVTDVFTAALGAAVGAFAGGRVAGREGAPSPATAGAVRPALVLVLVLWLAVLVVVFWYPFELESDGELIRSRLVDFVRTPFATYYFTSEYSAITQLFRRLAFFFPLGAILAYPLAAAPPGRRRLPAAGALLSIAVIALVIELGQVLLVDKTADLTDWIFEAAGGALGLWAAARVLGRSAAARAVALPAREAVEAEPRRDPGRDPVLPLLIGGLLGLGLAGWLAARSPSVPYNVRELLGDRHAGLAALLFSAFLYWSFGAPVWISGRLRKYRSGKWWFPLAVLLHGSVAWLLLRAAVPLESVHDIVGTPVLGWFDAAEMFIRFVALFCVISLPFVLAALVIRGAATGRWRRVLLYAAAWSLLLALLAYLIAVAGAATDNLTELMAGGGTLASAACLATFWALIAISASFLGACPWSEYRGIRSAAAIVAVLSLPLAYLSVSAGTAGELEKYGRTFSALQFLLSPDREHLASGFALTARYVVLHAALVLGIAWIQLPLWGRQALHDRDRHARRRAGVEARPA